MRRPCAASPEEDRGQILPLTALMLSVLLVFVGLGIDGAHLFATWRQLQGSADMAALAGAIDIPGAPVAAAGAARDVAGSNGWVDGGATQVGVTTPYRGDDQLVEVTIGTSVETYFLGIIGIETFDLRARAVARNRPSSYVLFAAQNDCGNPSNKEVIHWSGSETSVVGDVHSNSGLKISGSDNALGGRATYQCADGLHVSGSNNTFGSGPSLSPPRSPPVRLDTADFPCTFTIGGGVDIGSDEGSWWEAPGKSSKALRPGVYCSDGLIKLSGSDLTGQVTLVARGPNGKIHVSGSDFNLTPYQDRVLFFAEGDAPDAIKVSGSGGSWIGLMYAPNGQVDISGSGNLSVSGAIVADTIKLSGSKWSIRADPQADGRVELVE